MVFLELRRDSRVTTGNSGCLLCWPRPDPAKSAVEITGTVTAAQKAKVEATTGSVTIRDAASVNATARSVEVTAKGAVGVTGKATVDAGTSVTVKSTGAGGITIDTAGKGTGDANKGITANNGSVTIDNDNGAVTVKNAKVEAKGANGSVDTRWPQPLSSIMGPAGQTQKSAVARSLPIPRGCRDAQPTWSILGITFRRPPIWKRRRL